MNRSIERMQRKAIGRMTQRATIFRGAYVEGGDPRLTESLTEIAGDVPCYVASWRMPTDQTNDTAYSYQVSDRSGFFPIGTDIRRDDVILVDNVAYIVEGMHGPTGNLVEIGVIMRTTIGNGESLLP
jgi:hypothetical protein